MSFDTNDGSEVDVPVTVSALVPVGVPIRVGALLELRANAFIGQRIVVDFADSFDFNPDAVFGVGEGVSVDSVSWGLVGNRLAVAAPAPGTLALLGLCAAGLVLAGRARAA